MLPPPSGDRAAIDEFDRLYAGVINSVDGARPVALGTAARNLGRLIGAGRLRRHDVELQLAFGAVNAGMNPSEARSLITVELDAGMTQPAEPEPRPNEEPVESRRHARITWANEIEPQPVVWAWRVDDQGRIPAGSLSIAAGREGTGKSSFGIWQSAQITKGELPGSFSGQPRRVLYVAIEDSWKYTLVPRLMAAGADLSKVGRFEVVAIDAEDVTLSLPLDNSLLEREIVEHEIALVVIDPIMSVISERIDTHVTRDVRRALDPLAKMADRTGTVILGIAHFNKASGTDAANLLSGSHAFRDVPRSIFGFARDDSEGIRVMTQVKNSLGRDDLPSLTYTIETVEIDTPSGSAETGAFMFGDESERTVADLLRDGRGDQEDRGDRDEAADWLRAYLDSCGGAAESKDVKAAAKEASLAVRTVERARSRAGVKVVTSGFPRRSTWTLTLQSRQSRQESKAGATGATGGATEPSGHHEPACLVGADWDACLNGNCKMFATCVLTEPITGSGRGNDRRADVDGLPSRPGRIGTHRNGWPSYASQ
jgi:hypothetical protein